MLEDRAVRAAVDAVDPEEVVRFAQLLIRAPSENPGGTEDLAAERASDILASIGAEPRTILSEEGRPSVVASIANGAERKLVWNGHLDVVPVGDPEAWPHPPFGAVRDGDRLWGRGTADMKGPIASALAAWSAIRRARVAPGGILEFHLVADEEHMGIHGTKVLLEKGSPQADACVVGEPTGLDVGLAERGGAWITAVAHGTAAHGSRPHLGVNAITSMARFLLALPDVLPDREHPLVGRPTVNAALIRGGIAPNVVPDRCEVDIDRRTIPGETPPEVLEPFLRLLERLQVQHPDFAVDVEIRDWTEAAETPPGLPFVDLVRSVAAEERGRAPQDIGFTGITDARFYINQASIPTVILGPGDLSVAHTSEEHVEVADLVTAARLYANLFVRFLST